jgi:uncharacterized repeat protein (TIGR01451 family)
VEPGFFFAATGERVMNAKLSAALLAWAAVAGPAFAGSVGGPPSAPPAASATAPLLYVRVVGPTGAHVTFYPGTPEAQSYDTPTTVGLRPGYCYRVQIKDIPDHPGLVLTPTLEVRGSLKCGPCFDCGRYPAPVAIDEDDLRRIRQGVMVTKAIYLENPCLAFPVPTKPDQPIQIDVRPGDDPLEVARHYGRPVLVVHVGERNPPADELAHAAVPNTILLPGAQALPLPTVPPPLQAACFSPYDPVLGPRCPEEECLRDGGDAPPRAAFGYEGRLANVDPADTVAEYRTSKGEKKIAVSNPVCVCVPRFGAIRALLIPSNYEIALTPNLAQMTTPQVVMPLRFPPLEKVQIDQPRAMKGRERPSESLNAQGPIDVQQLTAPAIAMARAQGREVIGTAKHGQPPDCPLILKKSVDKTCVLQGEVVTFTIRYTNPGGQPIENVAVVDSLTGRLEYIPGTAKSDRPATFTAKPNEAGSMKLRWEFEGKLPPGQSGTVSFQVRVR